MKAKVKSIIFPLASRLILVILCVSLFLFGVACHPFVDPIVEPETTTEAETESIALPNDDAELPRTK
jgi:hypothetical protein